MKYLFLMDPLETVVMEKDTTFALMCGARKRGHEVYYLSKDSITLQNGRVHFHAVKVTPQRIAHQPFVIEHAVQMNDDQVDAVFVRTDPPFDDKYLMHTWMLNHLARHIPVLNSPTGIRTVNEKVWVAQFTDIVPPTMVSCIKHDLLAFLAQEQEVIVKPTNAYGGQSVFHIRPNEPNTNVILETLTDSWSREVVMQKYIPEAQNGDKRILLLNGEPLGAVLRLHGKGDHRNNFFAGGKPQPTQITDRDLEIIEVLKPELRRLGLYFVGIDVIGSYLIEVNVTSPTCLQEINFLQNKNLEETVIEFVERLVAEYKALPQGR